MGIGTRVGAAAGALALAAALGGCGTGQVAQTAEQVSTSGGAVGQSGSILVRDAQFTYDGPVPGDAVYQPGDDAVMQVTIVNEGRDADTLTAVRSPVATSGQIVGEARVPGDQTLTAGYDQPIAQVTLPYANAVDISLLGITEPIRAGMTYPVVFTFERAGEVRVEVPVENPEMLPPRAREPEPEQRTLETGPELVEVPE